MKKKLLKILCVIIGIAAIYGAAVGIGYLVTRNSRPITDVELTARMEELIPRAADLNEIIWGAGLPVDPDAAPTLNSVTGAQYRPVAAGSPYKSVAELREAVAKVYSEAFIRDHLNYVLFDGDEGIVNEYRPRYSDLRLVNDDGTTRDILGIDVMYKGFDLKAELDPATVRFVSRELEWNGIWWDAGRIIVAVTETYGGVPSERTLSLREQNGAWYLDEPTY